jgi:hypothetical protein
MKCVALEIDHLLKLSDSLVKLRLIEAYAKNAMLIFSQSLTELTRTRGICAKLNTGATEHTWLFTLTKRDCV